MTDPEGAIRDWVAPEQYPAIFLLDGDLEAVIPMRQYTSDALYQLQEAGYELDGLAR